MPELSVSAHDLHRSYRVGSRDLEVLRGVTFRIDPGERVFLCGASGAGKTTLLYTLAGLEKPTKGDVRVGERSLYQCSKAERALIRNQNMGFVFQHYFLLPDLTALENVLIPAMMGGRNAEERAVELLTMVGLGERHHHLPSELSGGEQQRVAIARALINDPTVIFADEPTGNLDSKNGGAIMELLMELVSRQRKTLIVVTHERALAALGDRMLTLVDGKLEN